MVFPTDSKKSTNGVCAVSVQSSQVPTQTQVFHPIHGSPLWLMPPRSSCDYVQSLREHFVGHSLWARCSTMGVWVGETQSIKPSSVGRWSVHEYPKCRGKWSRSQEGKAWALLAGNIPGGCLDISGGPWRLLRRLLGQGLCGRCRVGRPCRQWCVGQMGGGVDRNGRGVGRVHKGSSARQVRGNQGIGNAKARRATLCVILCEWVRPLPGSWGWRKRADVATLLSVPVSFYLNTPAFSCSRPCILASDSFKPKILLLKQYTENH